MKTNTYVIGVAVLLAFACGGLGWWCLEMKSQLADSAEKLAVLEGNASELQSLADGLTGDLAAKQERATALADELTATQSRLQRLQEEKSEAELAREKLAEEMQHALAEQEVTISQLKGKLTVNILDRVMFDSGKAELKPKGQELLVKVAQVLQTVPERQVLVIGHTDNIPVTASRHLYATNWELSAARATAAVRFLCENAGIDPKMLGALAYGEYHPIADNATAQGRAQNRRIEVVILDQSVLPAGE